MTSTAKKLLVAAIVFVLAVSLWDALWSNNMHINLGDDDFDGPLGALFGVVLAGGGMLIAVVALVCAAVFVGVLCAGIGIVLVSALVLASVIVVAAMSPLLLPLLIPVGLYWIFSARARRQRRTAYAPTA